MRTRRRHLRNSEHPCLARPWGQKLKDPVDREAPEDQAVPMVREVLASVYIERPRWPAMVGPEAQANRPVPDRPYLLYSKG